MGTALRRFRRFLAGWLFVLAVVPLASQTDEDSPRLRLDVPEGGYIYDTGLTVSGRVIPSPDTGQGTDRVDRLFWSIAELNHSGFIMFHRNGRFVRTVPVPGDYEGSLTLELVLTDAGDRQVHRTVVYHRAAEPEEAEPRPSIPEKPAPSERSVTIDSPVDGSMYSGTVEVSGRILGNPERLRWTSEELNLQGPIEAAADGTFRFAFSSAGFSRSIDIRVTAEFTDGTESAAIRLNPSIEGPALALESPIDGGFYTDAVEVTGEVGGTPGSADGLGDVKGLYWWLGDSSSSRRPIFFDGEGRFSFLVDFSSDEGNLILHVGAENLNGNWTDKVIHLLDGRLPPILQVEHPSEGTVYGAAGLLARIRVDDPYAGVQGYGGLETLSWAFRPTDPRWQGETIEKTRPISDSGILDLPLVPPGFSGESELLITLKGRNGSETRYRAVLPEGESAIPSFRAAAEDRQVRLQWDAVPDTESFQLTVTDEDRSREIGLSPGETTYTAENLKNGSLYSFVLTARTSRGDFHSHTLRALPLAGDTLKPAAEGDFRQVRLSWPPIPGVSQYRVYRSSGPDKAPEVLADNLAAVVYLDSTAQYGLTYSYSIAPAEFPDQRSDPTEVQTLEAPEDKLAAVARYEGLVPRDLLVIGDYAFIAAGAQGFRILDVSDPVNPVLTGEIETSDARGVAVRDDYAYIADGERGLQIVNITAPSSPLVLGSRLAGRPGGIAVRGNYAFVADTERGLRVFDVTSARSPERETILEGFQAQGIQLVGTTAFIPAGPDGLAIVDLSDPVRPRLRTLADVGDIRHVIVEKGIACALDSEGTLIFLDVGNPDEPVSLTRIPGARAAHLTMRNGFVFVATIDGSLAVYDARDPRLPRFFESTDFGQFGSMAFKGDYLYASTATGITVVQTYLTGQSYDVDGWTTPGRAYRVASDGNVTAVADHSAGVTILNARGEPAGGIPGAFTVDVDMETGRLVRADEQLGVGLYRQNLQTGEWIPERLENPAGEAAAVSLGGGFLASAFPKKGVVVWNIASGDPSGQPKLLDFPGVRRVDLDSRLLAAADEDVLRLFELQDGQFRPLTEMPLEGLEDLEIRDGYLYAVGRFGLLVVSVADPGNIRRIATFDSPHARSLTLAGDFALISAGPDGLQILNISRPEQPFLSSSCDEVFAVDSVVAEDLRTAYVADTSGIRLVDIVIPQWLR